MDWKLNGVNKKLLNGPTNKHTVTYLGGATIDVVWIGNRISWPLVYTTRNYISRVTDTQETSVLSLLHSWPTFSWQRLLQVEIRRLSALRSSCHSRPCRTLVNWQLYWVPCWRPFHTNLLVLSSQADFLLTSELSHSPTRYMTSLHSAEPMTTDYS
jgi:hypothetical protein